MTQTTTQHEAYVELYAQKARLLLKGTQELLSSGMTGVTRVAFAFSEDWEGLQKTAVFSNGTVSIDVPEEDWEGMVCTVPQQVLASAGKTLMVGLYGTDGGKRMLPTVWCALGRVEPGAVPAGVGALPPEAPLWARLQKQLREVAAANPFVVKGLSMLPRDDISITLELNRRFEEIQEAAQADRPVFLEVFGAVLPLTRLIAGGRAEFTGPVFTTEGSTYYHFCTVPDAGDAVVQTLPVGSTTAEGTIEEALARAKASGMFDGAPGPAGPQGVQGPVGSNGADGGYYSVAAKQLASDVLQLSFAASKEGMTRIPAINVTLPQGPKGADGERGPSGYELTTTDKTAIAEEVADLINSVEYEFMTQEVSFPNGGYKHGTVGSKINDVTSTTIGCYWCMLPAAPGETYRVSGYRYYQSPVYIVTDAADIILLIGQHDSKEGAVTETFTVPANGARLYLMNNQSKFVSLEKEMPIGVSIVAVSKSPISYKTIVYDGDSICHGGRTNGGYARLVAEKVGGMYVNQGVGGGRLIAKINGETYHSVVDNLTNLPADADLYCFQGGVNDFWSRSALGTYSKSDFTGAVDTTTVCGALEYIFRYALNTFVGKPVCFIITHKCSGAAYNENSLGDTFEDYRNAMVGICNKYSIPYYDAFSESGLNGWNTVQRNAFTIDADGCHPNEAGYKHFYVPQLISLFERIMPVE